MGEVVVPEQFNAATYFVDRNLDEGRGDNIAILCGDREITYGELAENVNRAGNALRDLGLDSELKLENKGVTYCATCDGALPIFRR